MDRLASNRYEQAMRIADGDWKTEVRRERSASGRATTAAGATAAAAAVAAAGAVAVAPRSHTHSTRIERCGVRASNRRMHDTWWGDNGGDEAVADAAGCRWRMDRRVKSICEEGAVLCRHPFAALSEVSSDGNTIVV